MAVNEELVKIPLRFVVHEHHTTRLHWDFRLAMTKKYDEGTMVLKSWAVPKGPPTKPGEKRLAVQTPDHPIGYIDFVGNIPKGSYGAGQVTIWDSGAYELVSRSDEEYTFILHGQRLTGSFALFHPKTFAPGQFLFLKHDTR